MEERLALNLITPEQVRTHPLRHVLTKALGIDPKALPTVRNLFAGINRSSVAVFGWPHQNAHRSGDSNPRAKGSSKPGPD